jgi:hypothetical protein
MNFFLTMADINTSQNINHSSCIILYKDPLERGTFHL